MGRIARRAPVIEANPFSARQRSAPLIIERELQHTANEFLHGLFILLIGDH